MDANKAMVVEDIAMDVFMSGPFLQWLRGFPEAPARLAFEDLNQGVFLHNILQNFDAAFTNGNTVHPNPVNFHDKVTNMEALIRSLKTYYEEELEQTLVVKLPDTLAMCHEPPVEKSLEEMEKLLLLILGAAVQCSHKEDLIGSIKNLPIETQHAFVDKIKEVTDNPKLIWSSQELDEPDQIASETQKKQLYTLLVGHLKTLVQERDHFSHQIVEITLASPSATGQETNGITPERNHLALEISEFKAKLRKINQQLEEKTETLSEYKEEMEKTHGKYAKLRQENLELTQEARAARALRDELDILRERANKVHLLESERESYKDKMSQMESLKCRIDEVREENKILVETKEMLEDQLESSRRRCSEIITIQNELYKYKAELRNSQLESENDKKRIEELEEENLQLQMTSKLSFSESQSILAEMETMKNINSNQDTNILTEQLGEEMSRIHRLELELKRLRQENEDLKLGKFHADANKMLALETENKKQSLTIQQLQKTSHKDVEANSNLQSEVRTYETKTQQLEQKISALKEADEQYKIEKETIIENLNKQVDSMKKRQVRTNNEQIMTLDDDNKKMVKEITLLETKVNKLERENKQLQTKWTEAKDIADKIDDFANERERIKSELEAVRKENEELHIIKESHDNMAVSVEQVSSLKMKLNKLDAEKSSYYSENLRISQELSKNAKNLEVVKRNLSKLPVLEAERDDLQDNVNKLKIKIENLNATQGKLDEQEQETNKLKIECKTLQRSNVTFQRKVEEVQAQNSSLESENQKLEKNLENFKNASRSVETLEKELYALEPIKDKLDRDNKSLNKQVERLKQQVEEKEVNLEDLGSKLKNLEREKLKLVRDLEQWNGEQSKLDTFERENRDLMQQRNDERKANMTLREDLVKERMKSEEISESLDGLHKQLKQVGLDPHTLKDDTMILSKSKNLEGSLDKLVEKRQKKIEALETTLKDIRDENCSLKQNIEVQKLKSGGDNNFIEAQLKTVVQERDELRGELSKLKVDTNSLGDELKLYKKKLEQLQKNLFDSQVENSTLHSQSTSFLSQINKLQTTQILLEASKRKFEEMEKVQLAEKDELLCDQAQLQNLHNNLQNDYDTMAKEKDAQKDVEKQLRTEVKKLKTMSLSLDEDQEKLFRAKEAIDMERESIRTDAKTLANLRSEHARLKDDFRSLFTSNDRIKTEYCNLQSDYKTLKTTHNQLKLAQTELKGHLGEAKDQLQMIDVEHSKTQNRVEVLGQVNSSLEEDRKNLMSHVTVLLSQYHELLTQTIDDKEHFHEEEKVFYEKMNNLSRQKEKLEEKIMDTYKNMNTPKAKKSGLGDQIAKSIKMMSKIGKRSGTGHGIAGNGQGQSRQGMLHHHHHLHHPASTASTLIGDEHDSSSVGSGGNDSLGSGHQSPNGSEMVRSESALELRGGRKTSLPALSASQMQKSVFRKSMPMHLEDSDGNNADDDSVNSFISSSINLNSGSHIDEIPTRDLGPERPGHLNYSQSDKSSLFERRPEFIIRPEVVYTSNGMEKQ